MAGSVVIRGISLSSTSEYIKRITAFLDFVQFYSPWVLFGVFITVTVVYTIRSAEADRKFKKSVKLGPGGKPLPLSPRQVKKEHDWGRKRENLDFSPSRKAIFLFLSSGIIATFLTNGITIIIESFLRQDGWWCRKATGIYVCGSAFFYCVVLLSLIDLTPSPSISHQITWVVAAIVEILIFSLSYSLHTFSHKATNSLVENSQHILQSRTDWKIIELLCNGIRVVILIFMILIYILFSIEHHFKSEKRGKSDKDEDAPLLGNDSPNGTQSNDGSSSYSQTGDIDGIEAESRDEEEPGFYKPVKIPKRTWWEYCKGYAIFFPYVWPYKSFRLRMIVVVCLVLLVCQRIVNIAVPLQLGKVTDQLAINRQLSPPGVPWTSMGLLILYKSLQGGTGILELARNILWIPVSQYSYEALTTASFEHVHGLSLDFHLSKRTGEVISALNKGAAINSFLESTTFHMFPMAFDLLVGIIYFGVAFDAYYSLIVGILTFTYMYTTIRMANWRSDQRREMNNQGREAEALKNDSLMSYETVKYFNAETFEFKRFRQSVLDFQKTQYGVELSFSVMYVTQNMIFLTGLLLTSFISAYQVTTGTREVGDFVTLLTFMAQLQSPLNYFGSFYRSIQSAMINSERLLELFKEQPTVVDDLNTVDLKVCKGHIKFDNVSFSYDMRKPAIEGLSFSCPPGTTTALVGESGGGKSTVFKLLFRFYNVDKGSIQIDGQDVRDISITSLRSHIGMVPQETILFNETIMYNLKYANQEATDEEIYAACRAASIHDKIMGFPDGYNTKVGERGLRLSGGEKQRVAIARAMVKNSKIILLDEATAALDSQTEQHIQESFKNLSEGRSLIVIAHRLSTITNANQILVLHSGRVVEAGTHFELLALKGRYYDMWNRQIVNELSMDHANFALTQAQAWVTDVKQYPDNSSHEASEVTSENEGTDKHSGSTLVIQDDGTATHISDIATLNSEQDEYSDRKNKQATFDHPTDQRDFHEYKNDEASNQHECTRNS